MRLFYSHTSPYARKAIVVLLEAGLGARVELVAGSGSPVSDGQAPLAQNPLGKVPVLARGDGTAIYDSRVICRYFDDLAQAGLYPQGEALWQALTLEATADGIMDAALLMVYESRLRPEALYMSDWVEGQWRKIDRALDVLEAQWIEVLRGPFGIAQVAVGCALHYLDLRHGGRDWRAGRPALAAWAAQVVQRPSFVQSAPPQA